MSDWKTLSSEDVYTTPWITVRRDKVLNHTGKPLTYSVVKLNHPSVFIIATNDKDRILVHRSYRYTTNKTFWEVPAGHSDGQDTLVAAKRELLEETGLVSDDWTSLGTLYQAPGIGNIPLEVFVARNATQQSTERDKDEQITDKQFMSMAAIETMIREGKFQNSAVLAALYLAKLHGL